MTSAADRRGPDDNLNIARDARARHALREGPPAPRMRPRPISVPAAGRIPDQLTAPVWETAHVPALRPADTRRCRDGDPGRIAEVRR
jgi:hypothetical protein